MEAMWSIVAYANCIFNVYTCCIDKVHLIQAMNTQRVSAWGNSLGIRLPQVIAQQVGFAEGVSISISVEGDKVVLSPARPKYTLDELLKDVTPEMQHDDIDWGEPVGAEIW